MKRKTIIKAVLYSILLLAITSIFLVSYLRLFDNYELETLDLRFALRPKAPVTDKVVIIEIGEDTIAKLGRFPFDRSYHAILIKALAESKAKAILFDIFFSEPEEHDTELEDAMRNAGNVYLPFVLDIDPAKQAKVVYAKGYTARTIERLRILARGEGHINIIPDTDGKFRRVPLYIRYGNNFYPHIAFLAICDYLGIPQKAIRLLPGHFLDLGNERYIPLDEHSQLLINFSGRWGRVFSHYSYVDILQAYIAQASGEKPLLDLGVFKDKICVIGLTAAGTVDLHPTPLESLYPGMGIHAEIFNSILNTRFIKRLARESNLLILFILGILTYLATLKTKPAKAFLVLVIMVSFLLGLAIYLFNSYGIWIDLFWPILAMVLIYLSTTLYKYVTEWKKRLVLESELDIAKKIQESFLPKKIPAVAGLDIAVSMFTARKVGGDLYDFIKFPGERLGVMIGDVSGKGVPASLFMAMVTGKFKFFATTKENPADILAGLNSALIEESASNLFVTILYMLVDIEKKRILFSNGGHLPILYLTEEGQLRFPDTEEGSPLGLIDGPYSQKEIGIKAGDILVLYTDGITEAMNQNGQMYDVERLSAVVKASRELSAKAILHAVEKNVRAFESGAAQHDDMTLMVIKIT